MSENNRKKLAFPEVRVLLFSFTIFAAVLTWIIPAGEFDTEKVGNLTRVIAGTFHYVEQNPQGIWDIFNATAMGFTKQASLIAMICFIGAAIHMLDQTQAFELAFRKIIRHSGNSSGKVIFVIMFFLSIGGATGVLANASVALVPIGIVLSTAMGLDKSVGALMIYWGAYCGFNVGWANPSTIGTAQMIAELPIFSGFNMRVLFHIVNFGLSYYFLMCYVHDVKVEPLNSLNYEDGMNRAEILGGAMSSNVNPHETLSWRHVAALLATLAAIVTVIIGSIQYKWSFTHFSTVFLMDALFIGIISGYTPNQISKSFVRGFAAMIPASSVVGFASGISTVLANGKILSTMVNTLSIPVGYAGAIGGAIIMFIANLIINCFIGSGSGQAMAVMPIMVPLADVTGITRQVAVQAFQFGDGLCNSMIPTATTLMASLSLAGASYNKYLKRFWPMFLWQIGLAAIAVSVLQYVGWTGL